MSKCDLCGKENARMFMDTVDGITREMEQTIRYKIESLTGKKIDLMPHLCDDCFRKYDFAETLRNKKGR